MPGVVYNNIENYLRFRGDIPFSESPFNEVDNLILSAFCYTDLTGLANIDEFENGLTIAEFARRLNKRGRYTKNEDILAKLPFVYLLGSTKRFGKLIVSRFVDDVNFDEAIQFSAMEIHLGDGTAYIGFRGTDDSPAGWKEDFTLTFLEVAGQKKALMYLKSSIKRFKSVMVGGHSKGGNLALYAVSFLNKEENKKVSKVFLNDSPGLCRKVKEKATNTNIENKILRIQPHFSVVGELLEPAAEKVLIVSSYAKDILEHDPFTWEVDGTHFVEVSDFEPNAKSLAQAVSFWLESLEDDEKAKTIDDIFSTIHNYPSISAFRERGLREILKAIYAFVRKNSDINSLALLPVAALGTEKTRPTMKKFFDFMARNTLPIGLVLLVFGMVVLFFPQISLNILTFAAVGIAAAFEIFITIYLTIKRKGDIEPQLFRLYVAILLVLILVAMAVNRSILEVYRSFIFGTMLCMLGFKEIGEIFRYKPRLFFIILKSLFAAYLLAAGGFLLMDTTHQHPATQVLLCTVALIFGAWYTIQGIWSLIIERRGRAASRRIIY